MLSSLRIFQEYTELARRTGAVNLAQGVPEPLFEQMLESFFRSDEAAHWQYVAPEGVECLREAVARLYGGVFRPDDVIVTSGCTEALFVALGCAQRALGNGLAFLEPYYPYYPGMAGILGMSTTVLPMETSGSRPSPAWDRVAARMAASVGVLLINTPHNPTGWTLNVAEASLLSELAEKSGWSVIVDHAYLGFEYDGEAKAAMAVLLDRCPRLAVAGSASKLLSATGLRVGWLLSRAATFQDALTRHMCISYCQPLVLQRSVAKMLASFEYQLPPSTLRHYQHKRDVLTSGLRAVGLRVSEARGGHFLLADYRDLSPGLRSAAFARKLAETAGVVCLPTEPFYLLEEPHYVRFSFGVATASLNEACHRLVEHARLGDLLQRVDSLPLA